MPTQAAGYDPTMVALTNLWEDRSLMASMTVVWSLLGLVQGAMGLMLVSYGRAAGWLLAAMALGYFAVAVASALRWRRMESRAR